MDRRHPEVPQNPQPEEMQEEEVEMKPDTVFRADTIPPLVFERMKGKSLPKNAEIQVSDLRYLQLSYFDYAGNACTGEMVCHKAIADDLVAIFRRLFLEGYPIAGMRLIDDFDASDDASMAANNTSCFNYRQVSGSQVLSRHARGLAVDVNPLENPFVQGDKVDPPAGAEFVDRSKDFPHKISQGDLCYKLFTERGFIWGGNWRSVKDYQHFEKKLAVSE